MPSSIMRNVDSHLLGEKIDEAVTHFINSHPTTESVQVDASNLPLNVQDENVRVLTVMHVDQHGYSPQVCRQVTVGEPVGGQWGEELMDTDERIAALVAHLQQTRPQQVSHHKVSTSRSEVDGTVILDTPMRLFNGQTLEHQTESTVLEVTLPPMPSLQNMKRCQESNWFNKDKEGVKNEPSGLELGSSSPAPHKQNKKSLPHKKRISKKLKRNPGNTTPQQVEDIVVITNCNENDVPQEEILPDSFVPHQQSLHSITHEVRPIFICQLCGDFYGEEQLKFYQHLKQHYEPHSTIIIENPVPDLGIDKMTNTCVVDNSAVLPDAIVELSLENTVPKTIYQTIDKHILYTSSDKTLNYSSNKAQYSMATIEKNSVLPSDSEKGDLYESLDKLEIYSCGKCSKQFRKQKHCEQHLKEEHSSKVEEMSEFSDPEDLMEGIHVSVSEEQQLCAHYDHSLLPHLTVDNGHVHQSHAHWYNTRSNSNSLPCGEDGSYCPVCPNRDHSQSPVQLKEEVFQRIFETEVTTDNTGFPDAVIENNIPPLAPPPPPPAPPAPPPPPPAPANKKKSREFACGVCARVFRHRNSLFYHMLSHEAKQKFCKECGKSFYTSASLKIHKRVHNGDRPYKCDLCDKEFKQVSDLKYHKGSIHSNQKNHKCDYCGKEFARKYSLNLHRKIHTGERNFKCDYCTKTFRASSYKKSHMRSHTGDKPYSCTECGKAFRVASDLRRHIRTHDKNKLQRLPAKIPQTSPEKPDEKQKTDAQTEVIKNQLATIVKIQNEPKKQTAKTQNRTPKDKKPSKATKKNQIKKGAAPNVTVTNKLPNDPQFKIADEYNSIDVFDNKIEYKMKDNYEVIDQNQFKNKAQIFNEPYIVTLKELERINNERDILRTYKTEAERKDNTDGKLQVYTNVKSATMTSSQINLNDIRTFDRDVTREVREGDNIENGFLEKLTALYNIPAV